MRTVFRRFSSVSWVGLARLGVACAVTGCSSAPPAETPPPGGTGPVDSGTAPMQDAGSKKDSGKSGTPMPEASTPAAGNYTVTGPTIFDATGKPHIFRGVARPSLEWTSSGVQLAEGDYQVMAMWGANVVRIPLNQDFWLKSDASGATNPSYDPTYADWVDQQVQWAEASKLDVILDLHWSDKGDFNVESQCAHGSGGCQQVMADPHSLLFWQEVATKYKNDPHVLFELYNEPNVGGYMPNSGNWGIWLNGGQTDGFQAVGMQQLYDMVRKTVGAPNLVVIGGLSWAFDLSGVMSSPVSGTNIIYATHPYQTDPQNRWDASFGMLSATYPIMATEFGDRSGSCATGYPSNFLAYANKKATGSNPANAISWTAWAFYVDPNPCTFPTLLTDWSYTPNAFGMLVKSALAAGP
jgi:endoglucanase